MRAVSLNRKARHDYFIEDTVEAGIVLTGSEVKALRDGRANLRDCYVRINGGEAFVVNMHISHYGPASQFNHDPTRTRKLLLHKKEIMRLAGKVQEKGLTLVPLSIYFSDRGKAKIEVALARGKRHYDKRAVIKEREAKRETERAMRVRRR